MLSLVAVAVLLTAGQLTLIFSSWNDPVAAVYYWRPAALAAALIALEFAAVGGLISVRRPENPIGWLLIAGGLGLCVYGFLGEYAFYGEVLAPGGAPASGAAAVLTQTTWALPFSVLAAVLVLYPTGRPLSPRWWPAVVPGFVGASLLFAAGTLQLWPQRANGREILLEDSSDATLSLVVTVGVWLLLVSVVPGVVSVIVRWRRSAGIERLQMRWLVPAGLLIISGTLVNGLIANGSAAGGLALLAGLFALPAAIAVAILRYRLYQIDRIISRVIGYGVITALLAGLYAAVVVLPSTVLDLDSNLVVAAATLAAAAGFVPLRRRVQAIVDRRFNRAAYDAGLVVDRFRGVTREQMDLDGLVSDLHAAVSLTVQPASTAIWIRKV